MNRHIFSGLVFLVFISSAAVMSICFMRSALSGMETPTWRNVVIGKWTPQFEKSLNQSLPVYDVSRNFWGFTEYRLFHQGRKGVVIGSDGWLFTDEEFSCPPRSNKNLGKNLSYVLNTKKILAGKNTRLAIVIVPEKARLAVNHLEAVTLPACRQTLYENTAAFLRVSAIPATDLLSDMRSAAQSDAFYLKTDTHWTPAGARLAAGAVQKLIRREMPDLPIDHVRFASAPGEIKKYDGDLTRYVPGLSDTDIPPDNLVSFTTQQPQVVLANAGNSLFDDSHMPQITLVGTSYSANPNWNFEGFLKESLQADVLNAADEGQGPFTVMDKYLAGDAWKTNPPRLVVWEIPERYLLLPHGVKN
jgi:alginate O-acetyltransferase complex protein AlgJ